MFRVSQVRVCLKGVGFFWGGLLFIFPCPHILATTYHRSCASSNSIIALSDRSHLRQVLRSQPLQRRPRPEPRPYAPCAAHPSPTPSVPSNARNRTHRYALYELFHFICCRFRDFRARNGRFIQFLVRFSFLGISEFLAYMPLFDLVIFSQVSVPFLPVSSR